MLFRPCVYLEAFSREPLSHSLARHRLPAALVAAKNCTLHFGNVVGMYRVFPFAAPVDSLGKNGAASSRVRSGRVASLPLRLSFFSALADRFVESPIFLLAMTARLPRLAETLREIADTLSFNAPNP